jgi:hypothetical protein
LLDPSRLTAIALVAGVEPLLSSDPQGGQQIGGAWNFDIGLPQKPVTVYSFTNSFPQETGE